VRRAGEFFRRPGYVSTFAASVAGSGDHGKSD
jgi:hypothetical protein